MVKMMRDRQTEVKELRQQVRLLRLEARERKYPRNSPEKENKTHMDACTLGSSKAQAHTHTPDRDLACSSDESVTSEGLQAALASKHADDKIDEMDTDGNIKHLLDSRPDGESNKSKEAMKRGSEVAVSATATSGTGTGAGARARATAILQRWDVVCERARAAEVLVKELLVDQAAAATPYKSFAPRPRAATAASATRQDTGGTHMTTRRKAHGLRATATRSRKVSSLSGYILEQMQRGE